MVNLISSPKSYLTPNKHLVTLLSHPWYGVLNRIYSNILNLTNCYYKRENIQPMLFPITTQGISSPMGVGSDSLPVKVNIKGNDVYLADSMQFCLEIGSRLNPKGAYYIMPTFRGENVDARHLNEFVHSEVEIKGTLEDVMKLAEGYIKFLVSGLMELSKEDIVSVTGTLEHLMSANKSNFYKIRYNDAIDELEGIKDAYKINDIGIKNITPIGEKFLIDKYGDFTWVTHLPWKLVPFYQSQENLNSDFSNTADLLAGIGEILGSGQRVLSLEDLDSSLAYHKNLKTDYEWYRNMRKFFQIQTSGFGMGIERFILWLLKHDDIRDCSLLLRDHTIISNP